MTSKLTVVAAGPTRPVPPFFQDVSQLELALDGYDVRLPIFYYDGSAMTGVFPARLSALRERMPDRRFQPARLAPGVVVDEAYMDFSWPPEEYSILNLVPEMDNVVVLRTFSKAYGLAGLRLGYGALPLWLADHVRRARPPFTVNLLAEEAALAVLEDDNFYSATLEVVFKGRELLLTRLPELDCQVWPSQANFVMFRPPLPAGLVCEELLKRGIIVRHLKSFGLAGNIRVNVGTQPETEAFLKALEDILHG